uniref:Glycosyltransferase n=1 Tax=Dianthus caryophyllus TaxID=3570 RepID=A7M6I6_DIACA|nr:glucosyltransferase [Dianthus caryophyllus]
MGSDVGVDKKPNELIHVLMISFPGQGHVNPLLRLGKLIASHGFLITFVTYEDFGRGMRASNDSITSEPVPVGDGFIRFEFIDDGLKSDDPVRKDMDKHLQHMESVGRRWVRDALTRMEREARPVSCLINNAFLAWVSDAAEEVGLPSAVLWPQSCASFLIYYYFHHSLTQFPTENSPEIDIEIPTLPLLKWDEIPSFLHPTTPYPYLRRAILEQFKNITKPSSILMDTFYELEKNTIDFTLKLLGQTTVRPIGPLFKKTVSGSSQIRADSCKPDTECLKWLDGQPEHSVVYISMGTVAYLKQEQVDEMAAGLEAAGVSFLWVDKPPPPEHNINPHTIPQDFLDRVGDKGKVISFSPQEQVLAHPALACFMTHCGWNSSMEAITLGVPVIAFPQWGDQVTDAKFLCDVFGMGKLLCRGEHDKKIIPRDEIERCLREATLGPKAAEMKENALKWKVTATEAIADDGSSDLNFRSFVEEIRESSKRVLACANGH